MRTVGLGALAACVFLIGCGSSSDEPATQTEAPAPVRLTTEVTLVAQTPMDPADPRKPSDPADRAAMSKAGYGDLTEGPGEPMTTRAPPGETPPAPGPGASRLVRFAHMPDWQLADDESPTRLATFDSPGATQGAYRPQDVDMCHLVNVALMSVNELDGRDPIDFLLLGGDNADSAQNDEFDWVLSLLRGADSMSCDSGADDDPVKGPHNDGKDPFRAAGLAIPWYWVTGNHDVLIQGNLPVTAAKKTDATGSNAVGGTRDWSEPGGPVVKGDVVPDAERVPLERKEIMQKIGGDGDGHGLGTEQMQSGKAYYSFDVPNTPLRFLILDTAAETGGSEGLIRQGDVDSVVKPLLDQAVADSKLVILASHHAASSLGDGAWLGGSAQPDAVLEPAWVDLVGSYPNVIFSIVGHSHQNRVRYVTPSSGHAFWEVMTSALADFPHQLRLIEIWDQDNGWLMLQGTLVDFSTMADPVAKEGRRLGALDFVSGWASSLGPGNVEDRNVEIWIKKP
jgi:3',5'-cyclic AMP phosphodiesterase CpdA